MDARELNDTALDREIRLALAVEPSPDFVARIRQRVAVEPVRTTTGWLWWAGAAVTAGAVIAWLIVAGDTRPARAANRTSAARIRLPWRCIRCPAIGRMTCPLPDAAADSTRSVSASPGRIGR